MIIVKPLTETVKNDYFKSIMEAVNKDFKEPINIDDYNNTTTVFIKKYKKKTVGFALGYMCTDDTFWISYLWVDKKYRRKGIATQILTRVKEYNNTIQLYCRYDNKEAEFLYTKFGFVKRMYYMEYNR